MFLQILDVFLAIFIILFGFTATLMYCWSDSKYYKRNNKKDENKV